MLSLDSRNYFSSPLGTVLESQSEIITLHDLTEAYATLSRRVRFCAPAIVSENKRIYPAFNPFQAQGHSLTICVTRDIGRCLLDPLSTLPLPESMKYDGLLIEEGAERGQAYATLSQHALVFLSDIFSFVPLTHAFSIDQLSELVRQVLLILSTPRLPTPSSEKTWKLAIWVLLSQNLQPNVWIPHKRILKKVLLRLVLGTFDGHSFEADGFRFFSALLRISPSEFLPYLLHLFPKILSSSLEDAFDVKLPSLEILRSAVVLKLDSQNATWSQRLALDTVAFIKAHHRSSQRGSLHSILNLAMKNSGDTQWENKGPLWALLFTACLIYITDFHLFTHPHSLKLIMPVLAQAVSHKRTYVRALHPHVWTCLVWCYSRLPINGGKDPHTGQDMAVIRRNAFKLVKQEMRGGIATALVASRSYRTMTKRDVVQVLKLVKEILDSSKEGQTREGIKILGRLLSAVGAPSDINGSNRPQNDVRNFSEIVTRELFVGSLSLSESQLRALLTRLPGPDERFVQPLTEDQIRENWKELVELWVHAVDCTRVPNARFQQYKDQLMIIWQSLLLVQSHLNSNSATTPSYMFPTISDHITSIVTNFIKQGNDESVKTAEDILQELGLVHGLWFAIKHSFDDAFLSSTAKIILVDIILKGFNLVDERVKNVWSTLCVDLVYVVGKLEVLVQAVFMRVSGQQGGERIDVQTQRQLWVVIANSELFKTNEQEWETILSFLSIPIQFWSMDMHEVNVWSELFSLALDIANASSGTPHDTLNTLLNNLGDVLHLKTCTALLPLLLPHLRFNPSDTLHLDFLNVINELLIKMYPSTPEDLVVILPILEGVARAVEGCESDVIVKFLVILRDGLGLWIRDEARNLLESDHNIIVRSIYCTSLTILATLPPSLHTLQVLSSFLSSSFERMDYPPIGPLAFEHYWRKGGFHDQDSDNFKKFIPEELKACLKAWSDHCGDSLAEGCTSVMDSQSTARSLASDSQSANKAFMVGSQDHEFVRAMSLDDANISGSSSDPVPVVSPGGRLISEMTQELNSRSNSRYHQAQKSSGIQEVKMSVGHKRSSSQGGLSVWFLSSDEPTLRRAVISRPAKYQRSGDIESVFAVPFIRQSQSANSTSLSSHHSSDKISRMVAGPITPPPGELGDVSVIDSRCDENEIVDDSFQMDLDNHSSGTMHLGSFVDPPHQKSIDLTGKEHHFPNSSHPSSKRLQSEPVIDSHPSSPPSCPTPLRRNHTTSERLDALERVYGLVADSQGASQVPLEELVHAAQITHKIKMKVAEQMSKKH